MRNPFDQGQGSTVKILCGVLLALLPTAMICQAAESRGSGPKQQVALCSEAVSVADLQAFASEYLSDKELEIVTAADASATNGDYTFIYIGDNPLTSDPIGCLKDNQALLEAARKHAEELGPSSQTLPNGTVLNYAVGPGATSYGYDDKRELQLVTSFCDVQLQDGASCRAHSVPNAFQVDVGFDGWIR